MTYIAAGAVVVVFVAVLLWHQDRSQKTLQELQALFEHVPAVDPPHDYGPELKSLREDLDVLRLAVGEGIQHVERVEKRIAATVRRAQKELAESGYEHDGLNAEAAELSLIDGGGGWQEGMSAVPESVAEPESSIPGVSQETLRRVRGM